MVKIQLIQIIRSLLWRRNTTLRQIPIGTSYQATRYDTDDEMVLSVYADGKTWDIRVSKACKVCSETNQPAPYYDEDRGKFYHISDDRETSLSCSDPLLVKGK